MMNKELISRRKNDCIKNDDTPLNVKSVSLEPATAKELEEKQNGFSKRTSNCTFRSKMKLGRKMGL